MTTLVTGAGLVGRLTAEMLVARGERVILADIRDPGIAQSALLTFALCDVTDGDRIDAILADSQADQIVHTAALLSSAIRIDPVRGVDVNVMGTMNILECARRRNVRRVVCASSTTVTYTAFDTNGPEPIVEDLPLRLVSQRPASFYAATKIASEHLGLLYGDLYGLDVVMLRYAAVIGGSLTAPTSVPGRLMATLAHAGRAGERAVLDDPFIVWGGTEEFVDARDCARANLHALDAAKPLQRVYTIANGETHDLPAFAETFRRCYPALDVAVKTPTTTGFAGFPHLRPAPSSMTAAKQELGFEPVYRLEDSIRFWTQEYDPA